MKARVGRKLAAALSAVALLGTAACTNQHDAVDQSAGTQFRYVQATKAGTVIPVQDRKAAGPVAGNLLDGGTYVLSADKGKVVVLNFWGSWCGPCVNETPQFDTVYRQRKAAGVTFVGLDVKDSKDLARNFVQDKKISYPIVFDPIAKTALQLGNIPQAGLPVSVIVDRQGRVAAVYLGPVLPADLNPVLTTLTAEA
jgi:thiol-disulfide isomerase/thioredoxin